MNPRLRTLLGPAIIVLVIVGTTLAVLQPGNLDDGGDVDVAGPGTSTSTTGALDTTTTFPPAPTTVAGDGGTGGTGAPAVPGGGGGPAGGETDRGSAPGEMDSLAFTGAPFGALPMGLAAAAAGLGAVSLRRRRP